MATIEISSADHALASEIIRSGTRAALARRVDAGPEESARVVAVARWLAEQVEAHLACST